MKMFDLASSRSFWKGINYHHENRIISWKALEKNCYQGQVKGSNGAVYHVMIDPAHPRKSTCDCLFAEGRRVICKHMIALYLGIFPEKEKEIMDYIEYQNEFYEQEYEQRQIDEENEIRRYVNSLTKSELKERLIQYMLSDRW